MTLLQICHTINPVYIWHYVDASFVTLQNSCSTYYWPMSGMYLANIHVHAHAAKMCAKTTWAIAMSCIDPITHVHACCNNLNHLLLFQSSCPLHTFPSYHSVLLKITSKYCTFELPVQTEQYMSEILWYALLLNLSYVGLNTDKSTLTTYSC